MTVYASLSQGPANDSPDSSPDKGDPKDKTNSPWKKKINGGKGKAKAVWAPAEGAKVEARWMHNKKVSSLILTPPYSNPSRASLSHTLISTHPHARDREESPLSQLSVSTGWCCPAINDSH